RGGCPGPDAWDAEAASGEDQHQHRAERAQGPGRSGERRRDVTQQPNRSGQDLVGDFQRWLVRSGARSMSREVSDQLRSALGHSGGHADVWERATTTPAGEAPECAWCPLCRAARMVRESGPGMASQAAAVGDTVVALVQDTLSAFESALAAAGRTARPGAGPARAGTV